ncbi:MAG: acetyl-CoA carboxylase biotin carboxylase subunit [Holosporales bacterium]|jgi:acetyl-CoA carboxylase biotin carboxylase subunit|nr:acetyl-CoA carboxylase biotin carboxylase subunit [Holosporales bacterium]
MFKKILIANRGEIALRIIRACHDMGVHTVAVHSTADADSMHVRLADESVCIGGAPSKDSYLNVPSIITAAIVTNSDAIHPGVGFLSENPEFAEIVHEHRLAFIGPSPKHIADMGDKTKAKKIAVKLGIPVVPGSDDVVSDLSDAQNIAGKIGYPVLIKAANGGGGRGMKIVQNESELAESIRIAKNEAETSFGNNEVYIEKYLSNPKHIEIQVMADNFGNIIHLGERDCSLQRRHQKIFEESPSPIVTPSQREELGGLVVRSVKRLGYQGVGTVEFLYSDGRFYFIEMNTRLQVEHPITEQITGIDIVQEQIKIAAGEHLSFSQKNVTFTGHSIECRINAEDPDTFSPSPGLINSYHAPGGPGVRIDSHLYSGYKIPPYYDNLAAKLIVHESNRTRCLARLERALNEYVISGIKTLIPLHLRIIKNPDVISGKYDVATLEKIINAPGRA